MLSRFTTFKGSKTAIVLSALCCNLWAQTTRDQASPKSSHSENTALQSIIPEQSAPSNRIAPTRPFNYIEEANRTLEGQLVRVISRFGPRYPIRLLDKKKKRLAYVDLSHLFVRDIRPYLNNPVKIKGEVRPLVPGSKELVIVARTLQLVTSRQILPFSNEAN